MARMRLRKFEEELQAAIEGGMNTYSGHTTWSFVNAVVYCLDISTTIGKPYLQTPCPKERKYCGIFNPSNMLRTFSTWKWLAHNLSFNALSLTRLRSHKPQDSQWSHSHYSVRNYRHPHFSHSPCWLWQTIYTHNQIHLGKFPKA